MVDGKFTPEERERLRALPAVDEVSERSITYSADFKRECMRRYHAGERPGAIFASAGLPASLIGYKRIERAMYHWREAERKGALAATPAPQVRHRQAEAAGRKAPGALAREREARRALEREYSGRIADLESRVAELEGRLAALSRP